MKITDVKVNLVHENVLKAVVNIVIEYAFVVKNIKIIEGKKGLFISMPSAKNKAGKFRDIAHPIKIEVRDEIEKLIMEAYTEALKTGGEPTED
jgi:stage V sporulation protein G